MDNTDLIGFLIKNRPVIVGQDLSGEGPQSAKNQTEENTELSTPELKKSADTAEKKQEKVNKSSVSL